MNRKVIKIKSTTEIDRFDRNSFNEFRVSMDHFMFLAKNTTLDTLYLYVNTQFASIEQ